MDVNLPDMNGIEATRIISHDMPEIKVIGFSINREEDIAIAMRNAGAQVYLTKEGAVTELVNAIRSIHNNEQN